MWFGPNSTWVIGKRENGNQPKSNKHLFVRSVIFFLLISKQSFNLTSIFCLVLPLNLDHNCVQTHRFTLNRTKFDRIFLLINNQNFTSFFGRIKFWFAFSMADNFRRIHNCRQIDQFFPLLFVRLLKLRIWIWLEIWWPNAWVEPPTTSYLWMLFTCHHHHRGRPIRFEPTVNYFLRFSGHFISDLTIFTFHLDFVLFNKFKSYIHFIFISFSFYFTTPALSSFLVFRLSLSCSFHSHSPFFPSSTIFNHIKSHSLCCRFDFNWCFKLFVFSFLFLLFTFGFVFFFSLSILSKRSPYSSGHRSLACFDLRFRWQVKHKTKM